MSVASRHFVHTQSRRRPRSMGLSTNAISGLPDYTNFNLPDLSGYTFPDTPIMSDPVPAPAPSNDNVLSQILNAFGGITQVGTAYYQSQAALNAAAANAANAGRIATAGANAQISAIGGGNYGLTGSIGASSSPPSMMPMLLIGGALLVVVMMMGDKHK